MARGQPFWRLVTGGLNSSNSRSCLSVPAVLMIIHFAVLEAAGVRRPRPRSCDLDALAVLLAAFLRWTPPGTWKGERSSPRPQHRSLA